MTWRVKITPRALKALAGLPEPDQSRVRARIRALGKEPRPRGVEKIKGRDDLYRIRAGNCRVVYTIEDKVLLVLVVRVGHRKDSTASLADELERPHSDGQTKPRSLAHDCGIFFSGGVDGT